MDPPGPALIAELVRVARDLAEAVLMLLPEAMDGREMTEMAHCAEIHGEDDPCAKAYEMFRKAWAAVDAWIDFQLLNDGSACARDI